MRHAKRQTVGQMKLMLILIHEHTYITHARQQLPNCASPHGLAIPIRLSDCLLNSSTKEAYANMNTERERERERDKKTKD